MPSRWGWRENHLIYYAEAADESRDVEIECIDWMDMWNEIISLLFTHVNIDGKFFSIQLLKSDLNKLDGVYSGDVFRIR